MNEMTTIYIVVVVSISINNGMKDRMTNDRM